MNDCNNNNVPEKTNPWLEISAEDYEGHMSSSNVRQLQTLGKIFRDLIHEFNPRILMIPGCTTGNGFEEIKEAEKVIGIDINPDYLQRCKEKYSSSKYSLELIQADLATFEYHGNPVDLIHAALIFEYVDPEIMIPRFIKWLKADGILSVVLQLESETADKISDTEFQSLKKLGEILNLIEPKRFCNICVECGLSQLKNFIVDLPGGKKFNVIIFRK